MVFALFNLDDLEFPHKENAMSKNTVKTMHSDHVQWDSNLSLWKDELVLWQQELFRAVEDLKKVEVALQAHAGVLENYDATLKHREKAIQQHEAVLAGCEQGCVAKGREAGSRMEEHKEAKDRYPHQREEHETLKKHHHTLIARVNMLLKAIAEPC
jgi:hypothetical protein